MSTPVIPYYEMRHKQCFADKCFKYMVVDASDRDRFIAGSFDKDHMEGLLHILQNGNWYEQTQEEA